MTVVPILPGVAHSWAHSWREAAGLLQGGLRASGFTLTPGARGGGHRTTRLLSERRSGKGGVPGGHVSHGYVWAGIS